ncbi:MAG: PAS domain-containing sensor histidine kinase [Ignavibacteriae bacterium]|nr:PAS domain-containing sensor histidine kinase [Ignavibacteriota bacterium]
METPTSQNKIPPDKRTQEDITDRERLEQALHLSEARYRQLIENLNEGIWVIDEDACTTLVNHRMAEMLGLSVDQMVGKPLFDFLQKENIPRATEALSLLRTGVHERREYEFIKSDGSRVRTTMETYPLFDAKGEYAGGVAAILDITESSRAEAMLKETEERFRGLFNYSLEGVAVHDIVLNDKGEPVDYIFRMANPMFEALTGLRVNDILGKRVTEVYPGIKELNFIEIFGHVALSGVPTSFQIYFETLKKHVSISAYQVGKGRFATALHDVTERIETEKALQDSINQLHRLSERLQQLREEERKSISRDVHDELGQVITALRLELMAIVRLENRNGSAFDQKIKSILELTESAIKTVQDISTRLRPGLLDDLGLVAAIEWQAEEFQKRSGVECSVALPPEDLQIDPERSTTIFRILQEALTNVARHAQASRVIISLSETGETLALSVTDNGIGIPEEILEGPSSLGLLGMKERLRPYNGVLTIRRVQGGGTELRISLSRR